MAEKNHLSDQDAIQDAFFRDGYNIASEYLKKDSTHLVHNKAMQSLYKSLDSFLEAFLDNASDKGKPAECRKGCWWCCHQNVYAQSHEIDFLSGWILENMDLNEQELVSNRALEKHKHKADLKDAGILLHKEACPLLLHDSCSAYEARPIACRIYLSMSLESCKKEYANPKDKKFFPKLFDLPFKAGRSLNEGYAKKREELGLPILEFPLEEGLKNNSF